LIDRDVAVHLARENDIPLQLADYNSFRIFLHNPIVASSIANLLKALLKSGSGLLSAEIKELLILRIASETGSEYEWAQHWRIARELGIPESKILAVRSLCDRTCFQDNEWTLLSLTDEILTRGTVSDIGWEECRRVLPTQQAQVEYVSIVAMFSALSVLLRTLDVPCEVRGGRSPANIDQMFE